MTYPKIDFDSEMILPTQDEVVAYQELDVGDIDEILEELPKPKEPEKSNYLPDIDRWEDDDRGDVPWIILSIYLALSTEERRDIGLRFSCFRSYSSDDLWVDWYRTTVEKSEWTKNEFSIYKKVIKLSHLQIGPDPFDTKRISKKKFLSFLKDIEGYIRSIRYRRIEKRLEEALHPSNKSII